MVVRSQERFQEMMAQAEVSPDAMRDLLGRLETVVLPFCASLGPGDQRRVAEYLTGLLSDLDHKTAAGIAYLLDQDRQPLQRFIGQADWDHQPLLGTLAEPVGQQLGEPDGVIVFDPAAFAQKGDKSVGVARQWCGRLGKVEDCQVGIYMG
jgi:SRSO17 transposase